MLKRIITLSIATMLAGAASAQQNEKDAQKVREEERVRAALEEQAKAVRAVEEANRRTELDRVVRAKLDADRARAAADQAIIEERFAQPGGVVDRADFNRAWTRMAAARQVKKEKVTFCGVSTTEPPPVLMEQLKLTRGMGLVIDYVEPNSPASKADLKQYDVITKFNDQLLSNAEQLGVLVRLKKPSDDAMLTIIRQGQAMTVRVELEEKEMEVEVEAAATPELPRQFTVRGDGRLTLTPRPTRVPLGGGGIAFTNAQIAWSDDQNSLTLDMQNGKATKMVAKDKTGKEIFNGPVETEDQRKALPAELQDKLRKAEESGPMRYAPRAPGGRIAAPRSKVLTSTVNDTLLLARIENGKAVHAFAFSTTDGKTLFDGPTTTDAERKGLPEAVAKQLDELEKNPTAASEFGAVGR